MADNIVDLKKHVRKNGRKPVGHPRALEERALFEEISAKEPDNLASGGDMSNILKDENDDEEK